MTHIDAETLALIALSEVTPDADARGHLIACSECSSELAELTRTAQLGRSTQGLELLQPPDAVWGRIQAELGLGSSAAPDAAATTRDRRAASGAQPGAGHVASPAAPAAPATRAPSPAQTAPPSRARGAGRGPRRAAAPAARRARFWVPLVAAAAVVGLVGGIGVGLWWQGSAGDQAAGRVIARAELDPFPDWPGARGAAVVEQLPDGSREVVVDVDAAAADDAPLREVWLIAADASGLVSIGFMDGTSGRFIIPAGIDLAAYPLVDVSAESDDGDPGHSGDSILRGELRTS